MVFALTAAAVSDATISAIGREQGLPSQQMHAVTQGSDGRMYFAGPSGLSVYDGQRVTVIGTEQGLSTHGLRSITTMSDGRLAVGGDAGLDLQTLDGDFRPAGDRLDNEWQWGFVEDLVGSPDGRLFIAASRGLLSWDNENNVQTVAASLVNSGLVAAVERVNDTIWAAGPEFGLLCGDGEEWQIPERDDWRAVGNIAALAATDRGTVLVGGDYGLLEIAADGSRVTGLVDQTGASRVTAVVVAGEEIWAGLGNELLRLRAVSGQFEVVEHAVPEALVNDLFVDDIGSVWAATDNRAIRRVNALHRFVDNMPAPCAVSVMAVEPRASDALLVAGDLCSWVVHDGEQQQLPALDNHKTWDLIDFEGSTWAATDSGLLQLTDPGSAVRHAADHDLMNAPGRVLTIVDGVLWYGSVRGLSRQTATGAWEAVPVAGNEQPGYVYTIVPAADGTVWVGTIGQGLWRWDGQLLQRAGIEGLPATGNAYAVALDTGGRIAVSQDNRLYFSDGVTATPLPSATGSQVAGWSLQFDGGDLWVGSSSGLQRIDGNSGQLLSRYTDGFGRVGMEFTTSRSLHVSKDWFYIATAAGLAKVRPRELRDAAEPPDVGLAGVVWRNDGDRNGDRIPYGAWSADVHFYSPWFYDESSLQFRYRLIGFDEDWVDAGSSPVAHYTALPAGRYILRAQAFSPLTGWGPETELWSISVAPPYWQHPLMLALYGLLPLLLIVPATAWRTRVIEARTQKLERAVDERTAELARANIELHRLSAQKDRMVSVVAHDLRTPFSVSEMYASLLEDDQAAPSSSPTAARAVEVIKRSSAQGINIIDSMLNLQAIESGRAQVELQKVELVELVRDVTRSMNRLALERRNVAVNFLCEEDEATLQCDPARIEQVLHNLVSNALKFTEDGTEVQVHLEKNDRGVTIRVKDSGVGIAANELDKVFKPYVRSTNIPVEHQAGLGIGLTICQALVEQHGGTISIDSSPGVGTTVSIFLPWPMPGGDPAA